MSLYLVNAMLVFCSVSIAKFFLLCRFLARVVALEDQFGLIALRSKPLVPWNQMVAAAAAMEVVAPVDLSLSTITVVHFIATIPLPKVGILVDMALRNPEDPELSS